MNLQSHSGTIMALSICNTWCVMNHKTSTTLCGCIPLKTSDAWKTLRGRVCVCVFAGICRPSEPLPLWRQSKDRWSVSEFTQGEKSHCRAWRCSSLWISHPDCSLAAAPAWSEVSATGPYFSSRCPLCRGCAGEYILSRSLGSGISRSDPVWEPDAPLWRSFRSSPIPWPGKCFVRGGRACPTRARPALAAGCPDWHRPGRSARPPPPHARPATGLGSWMCRGNQLHTGASAGEGDLKGEAQHDTEERRESKACIQRPESEYSIKHIYDSFYFIRVQCLLI